MKGLHNQQTNKQAMMCQLPLWISSTECWCWRVKIQWNWCPFFYWIFLLEFFTIVSSLSLLFFFAISAFRWAQSPRLLFFLKANFTINQFLCSIWQTRNYSHIKQSHSKTLCPSPWCQKNANSFEANQPHKMEKWK